MRFGAHALMFPLLLGFLYLFSLDSYNSMLKGEDDGKGKPL
jgi:hypothetical protein